MMNEYKCRISKRYQKWRNIAAAHPALAAQIYAEDLEVNDGEVITVMGEGKFLVTRNIRISRIK